MQTVIEHTEYPFGKGNLTSDGVQYSADLDTQVADVDYAMETVTINPPALGILLEVEFGLTASFRSVSSATADLTYKWQARNKGGTWVDLHTAVTKADINVTYQEETRAGRFKLGANFNCLPFEVRLVIRCNETNQGRARTKNSSYVRVKYLGA